MSARVAAGAGLALGAATLMLAALEVVREFPRGILVIALVVASLFSALIGLVHRGAVRLLGLGIAVMLGGAAAVVIGFQGGVLTVLVVVGMVLTVGAVSAAFRVRVALPAAPRPLRAVLFFNPRSGSGKAERFAIAAEARARGIEAVELAPGTDLEELVRRAVAAGADALAMAGGDGSQAIVAAIAAEHSLPFACVPAGTRNHFALDLGVDSDDVVGALDALVDGGERTVDLAEVNGRVFVNNVSLGVYGVAVQRPGYRNAKLRTLLDAIPDAVGTGAPVSFTRPDGARYRGHATVLVSNNPYRVGRLIGSGSRPRLDSGVLGVIVIGEQEDAHARGLITEPPWHAWEAESFAVEVDERVPAGIDGEATELENPLRFHTRPLALRVRISRNHPGASPSAIAPDGAWAGLQALLALAAGRTPRTSGAQRIDPSV